MPTYSYDCPTCGWGQDDIVPIADRDGQYCPRCNSHLHRLVSAPLVKSTGIPQGGGPDRFVADMIGIPLKELPEGLKTKVA